MSATPAPSKVDREASASHLSRVVPGFKTSDRGQPPNRFDEVGPHLILVEHGHQELLERVPVP